MLNRELYKKIDRVAWRLNHAAYLQQVAKNPRFKQFHPCPRALHLTAKLGRMLAGDKILMLQELERASMIPCQCHPGIDGSDLLTMATTSGEDLPEHLR